MQIKKLDAADLADFKALVEIFKDVFENDAPLANDVQLEKMLHNPDFMVFVVSVNHQVVGGLTIYVLQGYFGTKPTAYIYDVGVSSKFQGQGLGKALIAEVCHFCKENGFSDAYVEAEGDDIDALGFYRKTNFTTEMNAVHFTYSFNKTPENE